MPVVANIFERPSSPLNVGSLLLASQKIAAVGSVDDNSTVVSCDATVGTFILNLPPAALNSGRTLFITLTTTGSSHVVTLTPASGDTVGGLSTKSLSAAGKFAVIVADGGTDWKIVAAN
jgi:hypothetical protein